MTLPTQATSYLTKVAGIPLRFRYFTNTVGSVWDDESTWTQSGNDFYSSGLVQEINSSKGKKNIGIGSGIGPEMGKRENIGSRMIPYGIAIAAGSIIMLVMQPITH